MEVNGVTINRLLYSNSNTSLFTVVMLPENLNLNENISRVIFTVILIIFFAVSKEKFLIKIVSLILGAFLFLGIFVLVAP